MDGYDVSIIIPVYNVAAYIEKCLHSVMNQRVSASVECLLIDDGSEDESIAIAERLITGYEGPIRFIIIRHLQNRGLSAARNTGINQAKGTYLYFLDADDWIDADTIQSMFDLTLQYPEVEMVQGGAMTHGGYAKPWLSLEGSLIPDYISGRDEVEAVMLDRKKIPVTAWNRLILRHFLLKNQLLFEDGIIHEDELWTFMLSGEMTSLAVLKKNVYHYVQREDGISFRDDSPKGESLIRITQKMIESLETRNTKRVISYVVGFIQLRSFDILNEMHRRTFLSLLHRMSPYLTLCKRIELEAWTRLAKCDIRNHYWLYSLLYHWKS